MTTYVRVDFPDGSYALAHSAIGIGEHRTHVDRDYRPWEWWLNDSDMAVLRREGEGNLTYVKPVILSDEDLDPDPGDTTMTDTTTFEPTPTGPNTLGRESGEVITARTDTEINNVIGAISRNPITAPFLQKARKSEGIGALGLYVEAVAFTSAGTPFTHMKFFVVGTHVYAYSRQNGDARANWRHRSTASLQASLNAVQSALDRPNVQIFGHPVLVELTADDLAAIESDTQPPARFRGQHRIQRDYGNYDFEMDVVTGEVPASLTRYLRDDKHVTVPAEPAE
jgi:hypothetical protein